MRFSLFALGLVLLTIMADSPLTRGQESSGTPSPADAGAMWAEATQYEQQELYQQAINRYTAVLAADPTHQEAAVRLARCEEAAGNIADALQDCDTALRIDPWGDWADRALSLKAKACYRLNNASGAQECLVQLKTRFPDSSEAARAEVLEAQLTGQNPSAAAEALVAREVEATAAYDQGAQAADVRDDARALQFFDQTITRYPGTPAWLRAHNKKAHVLIRGKRRDEAAASFTAILAQVGRSAPHSRVALTAQTRLAALYHSSGQREQALAMYRDVADKGAGSPFAVNAGLQAAGLEFELLHRAVAKRVPISNDRWEQLRASCTAVMQATEAKPGERARAHLLAVETFSWQGQSQQTVAEADRFLQIYTGEEFKQDIATVRFFAGEDLMKMGRYQEALTHFRGIITAYQGQREIWPRMDHLPRTYFRIWEALERSKAPKTEIRDAANALISGFPESSYATVVAGIMRQEEN